MQQLACPPRNACRSRIRERASRLAGRRPKTVVTVNDYTRDHGLQRGALGRADQPGPTARAPLPPPRCRPGRGGEQEYVRRLIADVGARPGTRAEVAALPPCAPLLPRCYIGRHFSVLNGSGKVQWRRRRSAGDNPAVQAAAAIAPRRRRSGRRGPRRRDTGTGGWRSGQAFGEAR